MFGAQSSHNPNKDAEVTSVPNDGISSLSWSPRANHLVATCWNNEVYCWEVNTQTGQTVPKASTSHTQPVLCSHWKDDGTAVFTGGCDKMVKMWTLATNQAQQVAMHDAPIRHCFWVRDMSLLVTGSWDKTVRYWDLRTATPVHTQTLPERLYAMDVQHPLMVCGTADRHIVLYNLKTPQTPYKTLTSPLKWQTRCLACFPDRAGYLVGSIEGRVAVHHVDDAVGSTKNFTFKCHREGSEIYAVNSISFHPVHGTFATAGSDGTYNFWDKDSKQRLKAMAKCQYGTNPAPISCGSYNFDGTIYAYAISYDWSKGYAEYNPQTMKNYIMLHSLTEQEVRSRQKTAGPSTGRK